MLHYLVFPSGGLPKGQGAPKGVNGNKYVKLGGADESVQNIGIHAAPEGRFGRVELGSRGSGLLEASHNSPDPTEMAF